MQREDSASPPPPPPPIGRLIVFEGLDCSGKTTQAEKLSTYLRAAYRKFPDRSTFIGEIIDKMLRGELEYSEDKEWNARVLKHLFTANVLEARDDIVRHLNGGQDVVVDRYMYSHVVYWMAHEDVTPVELLLQRERDLEGMPRPDIVLYMDVDDTTHRKRMRRDRELFETTDIQRRVRERYEKLYGSKMVIIDATGDINDVAKLCALAVDDVEPRDAVQFF